MRRVVGVCAVGLLAVLLCGSARAGGDPYASLLAPAATCGPAADELGLDAPTAAAVMLCFTNYARVQSGLPALTASATLDVAGNAKLAADVSCNVFSHEPCGRPFGSVFTAYTRDATSYEVGENIAWGTGSAGTPRAIMDAWLNSADHRENILTAGFREVGIGYLADQAFQGYDGATLWSQEFGVRSAVRAAAQKKPAPRRRHRLAHSRT